MRAQSCKPYSSELFSIVVDCLELGQVKEVVTSAVNPAIEHILVLNPQILFCDFLDEYLELTVELFHIKFFLLGSATLLGKNYHHQKGCQGGSQVLV